MFFVRIGSLLAWLGFAFGVISLGMGFYLGFNLPSDDPETFAKTQAFYAQRYGATTGGMVDRGFYLILGSVVLGILAKIGQKQ